MGKDLKGKELGKGICQRKDGHHVLETELRNESGKVLTQDTVGER